jgi:hypothetical protein
MTIIDRSYQKPPCKEKEAKRVTKRINLEEQNKTTGLSTGQLDISRPTVTYFCLLVLDTGFRSWTGRTMT